MKSNTNDCMVKQRQCFFCGGKVTLIPAPDPTEEEVKSEVLDGLFLNLVPVNNLSTQSEQKNSL